MEITVNNKTFTIRRYGKIQIISSGYHDRFARADVTVSVRFGGHSYTLGPNDQEDAILNLAGIENPTNFESGTVFWGIKKSNIKYGAPYEKKLECGVESGMVDTTPDRLNAGIAAAMGFRGLSEYGVANESKIAATLTENEWSAVDYGLSKTNAEHVRTGKPVVEYEIPKTN